MNAPPNGLDTRPRWIYDTISRVSRRRVVSKCNWPERFSVRLDKSQLDVPLVPKKCDRTRRQDRSDIMYTRQAEVSGAHRGLFPTRLPPTWVSTASNFASRSTKTFDCQHCSVFRFLRVYNQLRICCTCVCAKLNFPVARKLNFCEEI